MSLTETKETRSSADNPKMALAIRNSAVRFAAVGVVNTALDLAVFTLLLYGLRWDVMVANSIAYGCAVTNSFFLNKYWSFSGRGRSRRATEQLPLFVAFNLSGLLISNGTIWLLVSMVPPLAAKLIATAMTFAWNYHTSRQFVFSHREPGHEAV